MKKENVIYEKSFKFSVRMIKLYQYLTKEKNEYILSKQILRSGTSIGANISEAQVAQSTRDFISKLGISKKEAAETRYWLLLLIETDYIEQQLATSLIQDVTEIQKLLSSIILTTQSKLKK
ncbi:four helix bundle protein [Bacillus sp. FJAT-45350]|uniref:four helix bundle protein n=1 Tax=Bacillus sp. FJAT-45350 TaxID=2011014 RepID=UPI000BB821ED|nr:four helix bundle protein [Bacillus sp. FJAT-45350]